MSKQGSISEMKSTAMLAAGVQDGQCLADYVKFLKLFLSAYQVSGFSFPGHSSLCIEFGFH